ncbi:MAG: VOC family protein [Dehalococcoidia bacterium]|nr:VOC family protein [Dehalococcoidia bacterium]
MTQSNTHLGLSVIAQIAVPVKDINRAVAFYRDSLGMKLMFQAPPALAFFDCNGIRLMLDVPEDKQFAHPSCPVYFKVADIQAAANAFKIKGIHFILDPHVITKMGNVTIGMAFFNDTEGNTMALTSEVPS